MPIILFNFHNCVLSSTEISHEKSDFDYSKVNMCLEYVHTSNITDVDYSTNFDVNTVIHVHHMKDVYDNMSIRKSINYLGKNFEK